VNWLQRIAHRVDTVTTDNEMFQSGTPIEFNYMRGTQKSPYFGERFQQHIEPAGRYMIYDDDPSRPDESGFWERGKVNFANPLVIPFNSKPDNSAYDDTNWKMALHKAYGGLKGVALSKAIIADGYDGIVTVYIDPDGKPRYTKEIVDLRPIIEQLPSHLP